MSLVHTLGVPYPAYLLTVVRRTLVMWVLARLLVFVFLWLVVMVGAGSALRQPVLGAPAVFVWLDRRFYHEVLLPANLGSAEIWFWLAALAAAVGMDVAAALVLGLP
jgi:hypothetical protein